MACDASLVEMLNFCLITNLKYNNFIKRNSLDIQKLDAVMDIHLYFRYFVNICLYEYKTDNLYNMFPYLETYCTSHIYMERPFSTINPLLSPFRAVSQFLPCLCRGLGEAGHTEVK